MMLFFLRTCTMELGRASAAVTACREAPHLKGKATKVREESMGKLSLTRRAFTKLSAVTAATVALSGVVGTGAALA